MVQWFAQHGRAVLELDASMSQGRNESGPPTSWIHYQHGVHPFPALLPNLQHLKLDCGKSFMVAEQDLVSLQILTRLQSLSLIVQSDDAWDLDTLSPLQHLTGLQQLNITTCGLEFGPLLLAPDLSKLVQITSLCLAQRYSGQLECIYNSNNAGTVIGHLTRLQELHLTCIVDTIPASFSKLLHLHTLTIGGHDISQEWPNFSVQPSITSCKKLTYLQLQDFAAVAGAEWVDAWLALSGLSSLSKMALNWVDVNKLSADAMSFSNELTSLRIAESYLEKIPQALVQLTSLWELDLDRTNLWDLSELPDGPYLRHLTSLNLCDTKLPTFPEALSQAANLENLTVFHGEPWLDVKRLKAMLPQSCVLNIERF